MLLVVILFLAGFARAEVCPESCHCYTEDGTGLRVANCTISALSTQRGPVDVEVVNFLPPRFHTITLGATTFKHFHSTKYLTLSNMKIRHVPEEAFQGMKKLVEIDLSFNKIKHVSGLAYKELKDLKGLYLRGNPLQMILLDVIVSKSLKELDLGNCGLPDLPSGIFDQVPALNHLYLDGNLLTTLHFSLLPRGLTYLNLANNKIADVPVDVLMSLRSLQRIDLSENPINCTCSLLIMQDNFSGDGKVFENNPTCSSPPRYAGKRLSKLDENELCKREFMPDPSLNQIRHLKHAHSKYSMQGDQNLQSDQPAPDYDYENDQISKPGDDGDNKLSDGIQDTDYDSPTDPLSSETSQGFTGTYETESEKDTTMNSKENNLGLSSESTKDQNSLTTNSEETTDFEVKHDVTNHTLERLTTVSNSSSELEDYSYDAAHLDYTQLMTESTTSNIEEFEGSGDDEVTTETTKAYQFLEEQENETVTENYSVENVTDVFNLEEISPSTEESTTVEVSSESSTAASSTEQSSEPSSFTEPETSSPEPSSPEPSSSTSSEEPTSPEPSTSSETSSVSETSESSTTPLPIIIEPEITKEFESDKENAINSKESFSKEENKEEILEAYVIYMLITLLITIVIVLALIAVCRRKKSKSMKVSLPADPENNLGTEMQDMLLPKPPENGIKVVPKNYTNGNTANGKTPEQKEEETPVLSEPERENDWDDKLEPIEAVTARMSVLARPQTPVFINPVHPNHQRIN